MSTAAEKCVSQARNEVRQVCEWLSRPSAQTMDACAPALERAVARVREISVSMPPAGSSPQVLQALRALAVEIHSTHALLSAAGELHFGRMRRLALDSPYEIASATPPPSQPISVTA